MWCWFLCEPCLFNNLLYQMQSGVMGTDSKNKPSLMILLTGRNFISWRYETYKTASVVQGQRAGLQYPSLRVQTWPKPLDFQDEKILSTPSFGGEVKPSVPRCRFAACKRSLNLRGSRNVGKITTRHLSHPQFHLSLLGSLVSLRTEAPGG